ncbi:hypothetical protein BD410DRAFT_735583, partial [Rickenella mellea]
LSTMHRPSQVSYWVGRARTKAPPVDDVAKMETTWWAWWSNLQPAWRKLGDANEDGRVPLSPSVDGDWAVLWSPGINGFYNIIMCLYWWRAALGSSATLDGWSAAVGDVVRVVKAMVQRGPPMKYVWSSPSTLAHY